MKLGIVVQRYGADLNGGAELHARYDAERLARHGDVEVLTTCARDYITWRNEFPAGIEHVNGVSVHRFPVQRERDPDDFGRRSEHVFRKTHSLADELGWLTSEGPTCPALVKHLRSHAGTTSTSSSSATATIRPIMASGQSRRGRSWCPRRNAIPHSGWRSSVRCFVVSEPSCTTRSRNAR